MAVLTILPFTRRVDVLPATAGWEDGWFRCFYSETLRSTVCQRGNVRMVPERIEMSKGGEAIQEVIGRGEERELPEFEDGAFEVLGSDWDGKVKGGNLVDEDFIDNYVPKGNIMLHTMRGLIRSIREVDQSGFQCDQWIEEPTLLVTRFERANLFDTVTEWYSAYVASRVTDLPFRPHLVFVDGHCQPVPRHPGRQKKQEAVSTSNAGPSKAGKGGKKKR